VEYTNLRPNDVYKLFIFSIIWVTLVIFLLHFYTLIHMFKMFGK